MYVSRPISLMIALSCAALGWSEAAFAAPRVTVVWGPELGAPARHGAEDLVRALHENGAAVEKRTGLSKQSGGTLVVLGRTDSANVRKLSAGVTLPSEPESLLVKWIDANGRKALLLAGADDRGLMYAAMNAAQQVRLGGSGDPLAWITEASEKPAVKERGISKIVMNQAEFESYFFSEEYWSSYLDMLARNRFNNFVLMVGYSSAGYLAPPYPWMFDTEGFPAVRVAGISGEQQQRNLEALRKLIRMTHDRGMQFTLALWTHITRSKQEAAGSIFGLTDENLIAYTQAALPKFLRLTPGIDRLQFRVHTESSLDLPQQVPFWNLIYDVIRKSGQKILVDMRAKGFNDDMIDAAMASGLPIRVATKYWGEQMGLPFHPTHVEWRNQFDRRHSYADLLRYPKRYEMLWRLWNKGTTRILLWGDPEWVRRFSASTRLYDGQAFEVNEPLAFKMGHTLGPTYAILSKDRQYYRWEYERYWHFYQVFGRVAYNPDVSPRLWQAEFEKRFGKAAASVEKTYHTASQILPYIVAYNLSDLSADHAWAEKQRWEDLETYCDAPPSDTQQFVGIAEAARLHLAGRSSARIWPEASSDWFAQKSRQVAQLIAESETAGVPAANKEFLSTMTDMRVLAGLADYHSRRIHSGLRYALFRETQDLNALEDAIRWEREAAGVWERIVALTDGVYDDHQVMGRGPRLTGSWKDELALLRKGLAQLERMRETWQPAVRPAVRRFDFGDGPAEEGFVKITSRARENRYSQLQGGYGWLSTFILPPLKSRGDDFVWGPPPGTYAESAFTLDLPNGWYELNAVMRDTSETPREHGPMWIEAEGKYSTDRFRVPAGQKVERTLEAEVVNGKLGISFKTDTGATWLINRLIVNRIDPSIRHVPVRKAVPGGAFSVRATAAGTAPLQSVELTYGSATTEFRTVPMKPVGKWTYTAEVPAAAVAPGLEYSLAAVDSRQRRTSQPAVRVRVTADNQPPSVRHSAIETAVAGRPLAIAATVTDPCGVEKALLRYRGVSQTQEYAAVPMLPSGSGDRFEARIPGNAIDPKWDLMYFIEVFDKCGNGRIYPDLEKETPYIVVRLQR
jgi:hypothetical protein